MTRVLVAVLRDLRASWGRVLAVALLLAAGVAIYVGLYAAVDSLFATRAHLYAEGRLADLEVTFTPEDAANVPDVATVPGVAAVQSRLVLPGNIPLDDGGRLPAALYFLDDQWPQAVNRLTLISGRALDPAHPHEALVDRSLERYHGYGVGDTVEVRVGYRRYHLHIVGVVQSPEYLLASAAGDFLIPSKGSLGVVYTSTRLMEDALGFCLVDSLALLESPGADAAGVRRAVVQRLAGRVHIDEVTPRRRQPGYRFLQLDLDAFGQYVPAILVVFAMVSVLATLLSVARLVHTRRREIGTLLALGYSPRQLGTAYLTAFLLVGALGVLLGLAGAVPIRDLFLADYGNAIGLPRIDALLPAARVAGGVAGGLAVALIATLIPLRRVLRLSPVEALRPRPADDAPAGPRGTVGRAVRTFLRRLTVPLERSLPVRFALRNLTRHGVMTATSVLCMALALAVAVAYFLSMTSMDHAVALFIGGARWDAAVDLSAPLWPEDVARIAALPGVAAVETQVKGQVQLRRPGGGHEVDALLTGLDPQRSLWRYPLRLGKAVADLKGDEVALETVIARKLGATVGDRLELVHQGRLRPVRVAGIVGGVSGQAVYAPRPLAEKVLDLTDMSTALLVELAPGASRQKVVAALYDDPDVARVTMRRGVERAFREIMDEFWAIVYLAAGLAIGVAILFVITSLTLTVLEREGEFATMEALGFGRRALRGILVSEAAAQMAVAVLVAVPVAWLIATYLNGRMSQVWFETPTFGRARDFVAVLAPALLLGPAGALPGLRHVLRLDIAETVRRKIAD